MTATRPHATSHLILDLSRRLIKAQEPIRILDAIKWDDNIKQTFFAQHCQVLPQVDKQYYQHNPLPFKVESKIAEFDKIIRDTVNQLGDFSNITRLIRRRCEDYCNALRMLSVRGTRQFSKQAMALYGAPNDAFYLGGPRLSELGTLLGDVLKNLVHTVQNDLDEKKYTAQQATEILQERLARYFCYDDKVIVKLSDNIIADAAAGADNIKLNPQVRFSERDLRYLEVHEGWVHVGTTLNGTKQPLCTFLSKGSPACCVTQEGLAVINEVFTFSSCPQRLFKLANRVKAIDFANQGADFIEIFRFFSAQGYNDEDSYNYSVRVFRGSIPTGKPFTKDLSYTRGFVLLYNYMRLAVQKDEVKKIPLLFLGKIIIDELDLLTDLVEEGIIVQPTYMPAQFKDLAALCAWMSLSLYLNKFDL